MNDCSAAWAHVIMIPSRLKNIQLIMFHLGNPVTSVCFRGILTNMDGIFHVLMLLC